MKKYEQFNPPERVLLGPGPSNVHPRVLQALAAPTIGHLDPRFLEIMEDVQELLRWLFRTDNRLTIPVSGTGSAGMEACFANIFERGEKVMIGVNGVFGKRMTEVARKYGLIPITFEKEWGDVFEPDIIEALLDSQPDIAGVALVHAETSTGACQPLEEIGKICHRHDVMYLVDAVTSLGGIPVEIDAWDIDACYSGTQKCLSCPPGLSPVTFSDRALTKIAGRKSDVESWYLDMSMIQKYWSDERVYHHTAPINMIYALHEALLLLREEGFEQIFARHRRNSRALLAGLAEIGLESLVDEKYRLPEMNVVKIPEGVDDRTVRDSLLADYGIEIGAGLGPLAEKVWRIGLMGQSSTERNVIYVLASLEQILKKTGAITATGNAVRAAEDAFDSMS